MKRLAVVDTGPTPIGDVYGPPEELEWYVIGALSRGEEVDQTMIDLVNEWRFNNDRPPLSIADLIEQRARSHHGGGAKSGQKTGGGGHPQAFGEHGKFAKAGGSTAPSTFGEQMAEAAAGAKAILDKLKQEQAGPPGPGAQVHSSEALAAALAAPVHARLELEATRQIVPDPGAVSATASIRSALEHQVEEIKSGSKLVTPQEQYLLDLYSGRPQALAKLAESKAYAIGAGISHDPDAVDAIDGAINELKLNRRYQDAVKRFGAIPVVAVKSDQSWDGLYVSDAVAVSDLRIVAAGTGRAPSEDTLPHPLEAKPWNLDTSMNGILRHEYGHHVESLLTPAQRMAWQNAHYAWGYGDIGLDGARGEWRMYEKHPQSSSHPEAGLSAYGRVNEGEAFAETFSFVTHPSFDRTKVHRVIRPMVDVMNAIIDDKPMPALAPTGINPLPLDEEGA